MTKTQTIACLAEKTELTKAQVITFLEELASLSYVEAKNGFTLPGIGKLVLVNHAARMGRNPATGEQIHKDADKVVKMTIAKALKDSVND